MNDDKDRILQACNSFSAEELFHFIRSDELTLLDLVRAGLDDGKLIELQELMAVAEDELWAKVQAAGDPALCRRYLQAYPTGRYARRCTALLDRLTDGAEERNAPPPAAAGNTSSAKPAARPRQEQSKTAGQNHDQLATTATAPQKKRRLLSKRTSRLLLVLGLLVVLLDGFLIWRFFASPDGTDEYPFGNSVTDDLASAPTYQIPDANTQLYNWIERDLRYFHDERWWDAPKFNTMIEHLQELYGQKDGDETVRGLLSQIEEEVLTPCYSRWCVYQFHDLIEAKADSTRFASFTQLLKEEITAWDEARKFGPPA